MRRRDLILVLAAAVPVVWADEASATSVRGKLKVGRPASIDTGAGKSILVSGDADTNGVLADTRLNGDDFEVLGHFTDPGHFDVNQIYTRSLFVHKDGKRLMVTYWCDVCYIRTYTPGKCWCCQKYTDLDLRESIPDE